MLRKELLNEKKAGAAWFAALMKRYDAETIIAPGLGPGSQ